MANGGLGLVCRDPSPGGGNSRAGGLLDGGSVHVFSDDRFAGDGGVVAAGAIVGEAMAGAGRATFVAVLAALRQRLGGRLSCGADNITLFSHAVESAGPSYIACSHLAVAYSAAGRFDQAQRAYLEALRCDPDNSDLLAGLAWPATERATVRRLLPRTGVR